MAVTFRAPRRIEKADVTAIYNGIWKFECGHVINGFASWAVHDRCQYLALKHTLNALGSIDLIRHQLKCLDTLNTKIHNQPLLLLYLTLIYPTTF